MIQIAIQISNETERNKRHKGPFIYYVMTFLGCLDPTLPLCKHVFSAYALDRLSLKQLTLNRLTLKQLPSKKTTFETANH